MRLLAFDSCLDSVSAALIEDGEPVAHRRIDSARGQAEALVPMLQALLDDAGVDWGDLDHLALTVGPGGFTGVRAGVAAGRALALATGLRVIPVTTHEALAWALAEGRPAVVVIDGRRGDLFIQHVDADGSTPSPPERLPRDRLESLARPGRKIIGPDGLDGRLDARAVGSVAQARLAAGDLGVAGSTLSPLYLRPPDARVSAGKPLVAQGS